MDPGDNKSSNQQQVSTCFVMTQVNCTVPEMNLLSSADVSVTRIQILRISGVYKP